jgi:hypothetical protein
MLTIFKQSCDRLLNQFARWCGSFPAAGSTDFPAIG